MTVRQGSTRSNSERLIPIASVLIDMSQYNRLQLTENLHAEVTDSSVYLAHEDSQWATVLDHDQFEELMDFYKDVRQDVQSRDRVRVMVYDEFGEPVVRVAGALAVAGGPAGPDAFEEADRHGAVHVLNGPESLGLAEEGHGDVGDDHHEAESNHHSVEFGTSDPAHHPLIPITIDEFANGTRS